MPIAHVNGVDLAYEEYGDGFPLIWFHEFAGTLTRLMFGARPERRETRITARWRGSRGSKRRAESQSESLRAPAQAQNRPRSANRSLRHEDCV